MTIDHHNPLPAGSGPYILTLRLTIDEYMFANDGQFPPAMFSSFQVLSDWVERNGFNVKPLHDVPMGEAIVVVGPRAHPYEAIWCKVSSKRYRKAMVNHVRSGFCPANASAADVQEFEEALKRIHADHVINRARLKSHGNGWVMLLPVPSDANSGFGSKIERHLSAIDPDKDCVEIDPLLLIKLYGVDTPPNDPRGLEKILDMMNGQMRNAPHKERVLAEARRRYVELWPVN